jgi:hypothetical protein
LNLGLVFCQNNIELELEDLRRNVEVVKVGNTANAMGNSKLFIRIEPSFILSKQHLEEVGRNLDRYSDFKN